MGFGLTISKMIVSQLKGEIKVDSEFNKGSTFTFEITVDDDYDSNLEESKSSNSLGDQNKTIDNEPPLISRL